MNNMAHAAQDFWLSNLGEAGRFNRWVFDRIAPYLSGHILEVGCGTGTFTGLMLAAGHRVTAVDINPAYVEHAKSRFSRQSGAVILHGDATRMTWADSFDTVVLLDVLEHIEDDVAFLKQLGACLRPSGRLVVKVPAGEWLYSPMDMAIGHFRRYTKHKLRRALESAGFCVRRQDHFNAVGILGWWLNGRVLKRTMPPQEQIGFFEKIVPLLRMMERLPAPGLSIITNATRGDCSNPSSAEQPRASIEPSRPRV